MGAGQFCTNPGIAVVSRPIRPRLLARPMVTALSAVGTQTMLTDGIAAAYVKGRDRIAASPAVRDLLTHECDRRKATPQLFLVQGADWIGNHPLQEEVFGPLGLIVAATEDDQMLEIARAFRGS